jgi:hypothetical protein
LFIHIGQETATAMLQDSVQSAGMMSCLRPNRILLMFKPLDLGREHGSLVAQILSNPPGCHEIRV